MEAILENILPKSLDEVLNALRGFGIEENEEILTIYASGKTVNLRISNIPTEQEILALMAVEDAKGYTWIQRVRAEVLSRAISWIDGVSIRNLEGVSRLASDPTDEGKKKDVQVVLRNLILGWGQELTMTLWKVLMVHSDRIEKRLQNAFPDSVIMTDVERRFTETAMKEIEDASRAIIQDTVTEIFQGPDEKE
jgi:hypothetical protein